MTASETNTPDPDRHPLHVRRQSAATALRAGLNQPRGAARVRSHLERALTHIREAAPARHNLARVRSVEQLAEPPARIDARREELRTQEIVATTPSIRC